MLLAVGDAFANVTVTVAVSVPPLPSETRYVKLSVPFALVRGVYVAVSARLCCSYNLPNPSSGS